jgi:hypothetical protein
MRNGEEEQSRWEWVAQRTTRRTGRTPSSSVRLRQRCVPIDRARVDARPGGRRGVTALFLCLFGFFFFFFCAQAQPSFPGVKKAESKWPRKAKRRQHYRTKWITSQSPTVTVDTFLTSKNLTKKENEKL